MEPVATRRHPDGEVINTGAGVIAKAVDLAEEAADSEDLLRSVNRDVEREWYQVQNDTVNTGSKGLPLIVGQSSDSTQACYVVLCSVGEVATNVKRTSVVEHCHDLVVESLTGKCFGLR